MLFVFTTGYFYCWVKHQPPSTSATCRWFPSRKSWIWASPALCTRPGRDCRLALGPSAASERTWQNKTEIFLPRLPDTLVPPQTVPHSPFYFCPPAVQLLPLSPCCEVHYAFRRFSPGSYFSRTPMLRNVHWDFWWRFPASLFNPSHCTSQLICHVSFLFCYFPPLLLLSPSVSDRLPTSDPSLSAPRPLSSSVSGPNLLLPSSRLTWSSLRSTGGVDVKGQHGRK